MSAKSNPGSGTANRLSSRPATCCGAAIELRCSCRMQNLGTWSCSTRRIMPAGVGQVQPREGGANALLRLMRALKERTEGLVLLTATPMQVHPVGSMGSVEPAWTAAGVDRRRVPRLLR